MMHYEVVFAYADDEDAWTNEDMQQTMTFDTLAEARAFEEGITYGDEPQYIVIYCGVERDA
jgi:hypothetical protein